MKVRRLFAALAAVVMLAQPVLAAEHEIYLSNGSLTIDTGSYSQTNGTGGTYNQGDKIVVKGNQQETSNTITVTSGANANIVLDNVNIKTDSGSGIDVNAGASANIELVGSNTVITNDIDAAAIHGGVNSGDELTITSDSGGSLKAESGSDDARGAGIGTNYDEKMVGEITIRGNAKVNATGDRGAGIGAGYWRNMTGSITIKENATVKATGGGGAGIGSGVSSNMTGNITIEGNTDVTATGGNGAGIGSGSSGEMTGNIAIGENATVKATGDGGAGIGAGDEGDMTGNITIGGNTNVTASGKNGAGIGSGFWRNMSGNITIKENANVNATGDGGAGIGSGLWSNMSGNIAIEDKAKVTVGSVGGDPVGAGDGGSSEEGKISYGLYTDVKDIDGNIINAPAAKPSAPAAKPAPVSLSRVYDEETQTYYVEHWTELSLTLHSEDVDVPEELSKEGDNVVRSVNLTAEGNLPKSFTLGFELGEEFAGKTVEIRYMTEDGEVKTVRMVADGEGTVTMNAKELGTYVLVEIG